MLEALAGQEVFKITAIREMPDRLRQISISGLAGHHPGDLWQDMIKIKPIETTKEPALGF